MKKKVLAGAMFRFSNFPTMSEISITATLSPLFPPHSSSSLLPKLPLSASRGISLPPVHHTLKVPESKHQMGDQCTYSHIYNTSTNAKTPNNGT
jgi:hypothetical protein